MSGDSSNKRLTNKNPKFNSGVAPSLLKATAPISMVSIPWLAIRYGTLQPVDNRPRRHGRLAGHALVRRWAPAADPWERWLHVSRQIRALSRPLEAAQQPVPLDS